MDNPRNHALLQTKLAELGHASAQIKFIKAERPARWTRTARRSRARTGQPARAETSATADQSRRRQPAPPVKEKPAPVTFSKDDFKNDPLIQKALEIFKGQIVEVRS